MNITIKSRFKFNELIHDTAYGLAKRMILKDKDKAIKKIHGFVLTASKTRKSVFVKVQKAT